MADETETNTESEKDAKPETEKVEGEQQTEAKKPKTLEEALALIDKTTFALSEANAEAAKRRKALKKFEDEETKRKQADEEKRKSELSDVEKLKQETAEKDRLLKQQAEEFKAERIKSAVELAATKMNFHKPEQAYRLADLKEVDIEDGKIVGVEEALKALAKDSPHLIKSEQTTGTEIDATRRTTGKPVMTDDEKAKLADLYGVKPQYIK
jgi:hypothetical protein